MQWIRFTHTQAKLVRQSTTYLLLDFCFRACLVNGNEIKIGDNVSVKLDDEKCAIGNVIELFENLDDDPHRAKIKWYFKHTELPERFQTSRFGQL